LDHIVTSLQAGKSVVLSFGEFESDLDYLLVSNVLTRLIRQRWVEKTNQFRSQGRDEPRQLIIVLEEAQQVAQPPDGSPDHLQHNRPGDAQVLRHPADHRPATVTDLR